MANFFISVGIINKKMIFPLIYLILYFFVNIYHLYVGYNEVSEFLDGFGYSLGELSTFFIGVIIKYRRIVIKKKKMIGRN